MRLLASAIAGAIFFVGYPRGLYIDVSHSRGYPPFTEKLVGGGLAEITPL